MIERSKYKIKVKQSIKFIESIIDVIPEQSIISFEGDLGKLPIPKNLMVEGQNGLHKRHVSTPKQDFWIFKLDNESTQYLKNDFLKRIGVRSNVIHILISCRDELLFSSYDNFDLESSTLIEFENINTSFLNELLKERIILKYLKI